MKSTIIAIILFVSFSSFAKNPTMEVAPVSGSVYNVFYKSVDAGTVKVSILNSNKEVVFSETLTEVSSFKRPYNFSNLAEGNYTIVLEDKNGKQVQEVSYQMNKVNTFIHVNQLATDDNKYVLNVTNDGAENVYVKIYKNGTEILHEQQLTVNGTYALMYNLSLVKATDSTITFEVTASSGKVQRMTF